MSGEVSRIDRVDYVAAGVDPYQERELRAKLTDALLKANVASLPPDLAALRRDWDALHWRRRYVLAKPGKLPCRIETHAKPEQVWTLLGDAMQIELSLRGYNSDGRYFTPQHGVNATLEDEGLDWHHANGAVEYTGRDGTFYELDEPTWILLFFSEQRA